MNWVVRNECGGVFVLPRFCRDCAHVRDFDRETFEKCGALPTTNIVTGGTDYGYCSAARMESGKCGPDGKLWEPKP